MGERRRSPSDARGCVPAKSPTPEVSRKRGKAFRRPRRRRKYVRGRAGIVGTNECVPRPLPGSRALWERPIRGFRLAPEPTSTFLQAYGLIISSTQPVGL